MKRVRRQSHRKALIDACRLLGYAIVPASEKYGPYTRSRYQYVVLNSVGNVLRIPGGWDENRESGYVISFRFMWVAAMHVLQKEGVNVDALKPPRKAGNDRGATSAVCGVGPDNGTA
jgi:hypothetical protein